MGKFHFFNNSRCPVSAENSHVRCKRINVNSECDIIARIKQRQDDLNIIDTQIAATEMLCQEMQTVNAFLLSDAMVSVIREIYRCQNRYGYEGQAVIDKHILNDLRLALSRIPDIDKFCEEVKTIHDKEVILQNLRAEKVAVSKQIYELKAQLGIQ